MKFYNVMIAFMLIGCSGSDPGVFNTSSGGEAGGDGEAGGKGDAGGDSSSSEGGSGEGEGGQGTTSQSSGGCQPSTTCASVGAECGTILDDGCGAQVECPNNCTGDLTCGGGGDQFKCGCTPKTCLDLGAECGEATDGCGGALDCGGCDSTDPYVSCGGPEVDVENDGELTSGEDNVCNTGCVYLGDVARNDQCVNFTMGTELKRGWRCPFQNESLPPLPGCVNYPDGTFAGFWCCASQ